MKDIYTFELDNDEYTKLIEGKKTVQLAINDAKHKVFAIGNKLTFLKKVEENNDESAQEIVSAEIENLLYFGDINEAIGTLGKEACGFKASATFEKASDKFLSNEKYEMIEKYGLVAVVFKLIEE